MLRSVTEIIESVTSAQELYWVQLKIELISSRASSKSVRRWEEALALKRQAFGVIDKYAYSWKEEDQLFIFLESIKNRYKDDDWRMKKLYS